MRRRAILTAVAAALLVLAVSVAVQAATKTTLHLQANPSGKIKYNKKTLTAKAGKVTIVMKNPSSSGLHHGIAVEGKGVDKDGKIVAPGKTSTLTLTLKKGRYTFYCNYDGHKNMGMKGTLIVK